MELYLFSPYMPSWRGQGQLYFVIFGDMIVNDDTEKLKAVLLQHSHIIEYRKD